MGFLGCYGMEIRKGEMLLEKESSHGRECVVGLCCGEISAGTEVKGEERRLGFVLG